MELVEFGSGVGHFKGGIYGNAGSGKTHTAILFAIGIRKHLGLPGPVGFLDTETGVEYVNPIVKEATGLNAVGLKTRALSDAISIIKEWEKRGISVGVIDSVTHIWEEVQASYLAQMNSALTRKGRNPKTTIEWQDRGPLNEIWQRFSDAFTNSPVHLIICGRAQNIWERKENEDTGKTELNVKGTKMRTQSELAYEPSFLAEMARDQRIENGKPVIFRTMTVMKDRFRLLDGKQFENPTFEAIKPHIDCIRAGASNTVDTSRRTEMGVTEDGDAEWTTEKKTRVILCEEIQAEFVRHLPGQTAADKKAKVGLLEKCFGTTSWTAVESMSSDRLRRGMEDLVKAFEPMTPAVLTAEKEA